MQFHHRRLHAPPAAGLRGEEEAGAAGRGRLQGAAGGGGRTGQVKNRQKQLNAYAISIPPPSSPVLSLRPQGADREGQGPCGGAQPRGGYGAAGRRLRGKGAHGKDAGAWDVFAVDVL